MLRKIMIVLVAGAALSGATTAEAFHGGGGGGGGGHVGGGFGGGGFGGARLGGGFGAAHAGGQAFGRAFVGPNFATARGHLDHGRGVGRHLDHDRRFVRGYGYWPDWDYSYDSSCGYVYPYYNYNPYSCYPPSY